MIDEPVLQRLDEAIEFIALYMHNETDWISVKKQLLLRLPWEIRGMFSRRNEKTKKHTISEFDRMVIERWKRQVGNDLILAEEKRHVEK